MIPSYVLAICIPVTSRTDYETYALPGVSRLVAAAPDTLVLAETSLGGYPTTVNAMLERLGTVSGLDGVIVIHQDLELLDGSAPHLLRSRFRDGRVAIAGAVGSTDRTGLSWSSGRQLGMRVELPDPYPPIVLGGGGIAAAVDGLLLAFSPWAVKHLRFADSFDASFHGYDIDICLQARAYGKLVAAVDIPVRHHQIDGLRRGRDRTWIAAQVEMRRKWDLADAPPGLAWALGPEPR